MPISIPITEEQRKELYGYFPELQPLLSRKQLDLLTYSNLMDLGVIAKRGDMKPWQSAKLRQLVGAINNNYPDIED